VTDTKTKPHIFFLITKGDIGGAQIQVLSLIKNLSQHYRFTLGCGEKGFLTNQATKSGVDVVIVPHLQRSLSLVEDIKCFFHLKTILKKYNPDLVHIHSSKAGIIGRFAARAAGYSSLFTAHGWAFTPGVGLLRKIYGGFAEWIAARAGNGIISVSEFDFNLAEKFRVRSGKHNYLVCNGVESNMEEKDYKDTPLVKILSIGRMTKQKNQKMIIQALSRTDRRFKLTLVGSGALRSDLQSLVTEYGIDDQVEFVESQEDITRWFLEADIFLLSSIYEGLPLSILEAMRAGLPVISTNVGGVSEAVIDGVTGFLVNSGDEHMLESRINQLIDDFELRKKFSENGFQYYQENFRASQMCTKTSKVYDTLIGQI
jgi:glycosyltransferase involved in cell wall biosynthesis